MANLDRVLDKAKRLAELGADHVLLHDPAGALDPGTCGRVVARLAEEAGVPVGLYCQGESAWPWRSRLPATAPTPVAVAAYPSPTRSTGCPARCCARRLTGLDIEHGLDTERLWDASQFIDEHVNSQMPAASISPRITLRAARNRLPVGLVADLDTRLRRATGSDRLDEVLDELKIVREDCGRPPLAQPIGGILAGQALRHVLSARRWADASEEMKRYLSASYGRPPLEISSEAARMRARLIPSPTSTWTSCASRPGRRARRICCCSRCSAPTPSGCSPPCAAEVERESDVDASLEPAQSERIRELIQLVEDSDVGEVTIEDGSVRITVRQAGGATRCRSRAGGRRGSGAHRDARSARHSRSNRRWWARSTARRRPISRAFVAEGDTVVVGQTLCILEAMKLFNELKSDHSGVIRRILVENAEPVEFGQPLFELEPV